MSDWIFKSKRDAYGFKTERERAEYCLKRSGSARNESASDFWRREAAEAALNSLENEE